MREAGYDRATALMYAHRWAFARNPRYAQFDLMGGDCTNYASQVLFAGGCEMNFGPSGWYYRGLADRAPAWSGVEELHRFLIGNRGVGPHAEEVTLARAEPGDLIQLRFASGDRYRHTPVIVALGEPGDLDHVLVAAHTLNADWRPLSSYSFAELRVLHILGSRSAT